MYTEEQLVIHHQIGTFRSIWCLQWFYCYYFDKAHNGFYWNNMLCLQGDFDIIGGETALTEAEVIKVDIFLSCLDLY